MAIKKVTPGGARGQSYKQKDGKKDMNRLKKAYPGGLLFD
jgi:hypothetical protein